jgi:hypothetical protein
MTSILEKLKKVAERVNAEKPELHFFALVHRVDAPDRWDLLVSSDKLEPWSMDALKYIVGHLKKVLSADEITRIAQVVVLPRDSKVISSLNHNPQVQAGELSFLHPADRFDQAFVIWPADLAHQHVQGKSRHPAA